MSVLGLLCAVFVGASAADVLPADSLVSYLLEEPLRELRYHLRVEGSRRHVSALSLYWNYRDSLNHRRADLCLPPVRSEPYAEEASAVIVRRCEGDDSIEYSTAVPLVCGADGCVSLRLTATSAGSALEIGAERAAVSLPVSFDLDYPGALAVCTRRTLKAPINFLFTAAAPTAPIAKPDSSAVAPLAGTWTFLDRDMDASQAYLPERYTLRLLPDGDTYLIYTDAGEYKGRLTPSPFSSHWYLSWVTADRRLLDSETSADLETSGLTLRLNFPLLRTSLRFVRADGEVGK